MNERSDSTHGARHAPWQGDSPQVSVNGIFCGCMMPCIRSQGMTSQECSSMNGPAMQMLPMNMSTGE